MNESVCEIDEHGTKVWRRVSDGEIHRENGPAIEYLDGTIFWIKDEVEHREDGPAIMYPNGEQHWFSHGKHHRLDGPAIEYISGPFFNEWYINGYYITDEITQWAKENEIDLNNLTEVDKALIKLAWGDYEKC